MKLLFALIAIVFFTNAFGQGKVESIVYQDIPAFISGFSNPNHIYERTCDCFDNKMIKTTDINLIDHCDCYLTNRDKRFYENGEFDFFVQDKALVGTYHRKSNDLWHLTEYSLCGDTLVTHSIVVDYGNPSRSDTIAQIDPITMNRHLKIIREIPIKTK